MFRFINKKKNKSPASTPPPIRQRYKILFSASFKLVFLFFYDIIILFDNFFIIKKVLKIPWKSRLIRFDQKTLPYDDYGF